MGFFFCFGGFSSEQVVQFCVASPEEGPGFESTIVPCGVSLFWCVTGKLPKLPVSMNVCLC